VSVMEGYAMRTLLKRTGLKLNEMSGKMAIFSLLIGTLVIQGYFAIVLFGDLNLAQAQHHIPILGMILSNALTAMILAVKTLQQGLIHRRNQIETLLMLGASRHQALLPLIKASFEAALVPTFNAMLTMGIVALPGMMTGQILAGVQPLEAVMYQIAIMCAICATTAITLTIFFLACQKLLFDEYHALKANL
ncbi:MAG: ABC transporter permease, partial [Culicoidibacterales bacterium]